MPQHLTTRIAQPLLHSSASAFSISSFLVPFLHKQTRNASILSSLSDTPGAYNRRIRRGRGPSSGKGKTSGRGHKGQKQHGKVPKGFQGGQTPEEISHGKFGFKNVHAVEMSPVNLDKIQAWIDAGRLDPEKPITLKELKTSRAVHGIKDGIKLLANGASMLKTPVNIIVSRASQAAITAVESVGGTVTTRFYTPKAIQRISSGLMHPYISMRWDPTAINNNALIPVNVAANTPEDRVTGLGYEYRLPDPSSRKEIEYYRDVKNRGYLSHTVQRGETASLYFKAPISEEEIAKLKKNRGQSEEAKQKEENKLW